jgi:8-oxo-dGTP diphosphatase
MSEPPLYERDPEAWNKYLAEGNVKQARKRVAVDALLRDRNGRILVVKPNYKPGWDLPGGMVEANEAPVDGLRRELAEELGLHVPSLRLLCIDWVPPHGPWDDQLSFIFDGGVVTTEIRVSASDSELTEVRFVDRGELRSLLRDDSGGGRRLRSTFYGARHVLAICTMESRQRASISGKSSGPPPLDRDRS